MKSEARLGPPTYNLMRPFAIPAVAMPGQYRFE